MPHAIVLRLLRHDARMWWYFATLRKQGQVEEAQKLERESIREQIRFIRRNVGRRATTHRISVIEFLDRPGHRPFDLQPETGGRSYTAFCSNMGVGDFAAWVYCYAHRIGLRYTPKLSDRV